MKQICIVEQVGDILFINDIENLDEMSIQDFKNAGQFIVNKGRGIINGVRQLPNQFAQGARQFGRDAQVLAKYRNRILAANPNLKHDAALALKLDAYNVAADVAKGAVADQAMSMMPGGQYANMVGNVMDVAQYGNKAVKGVANATNYLANNVRRAVWQDPNMSLDQRADAYHDLKRQARYQRAMGYA